MTVPIRPLVDRTYLEQVLLSRFSHGEVQQWVQKYFQPYRELMSYYRCAIMEVETKFNVLKLLFVEHLTVSVSVLNKSKENETLFSFFYMS